MSQEAAAAGKHAARYIRGLGEQAAVPGGRTIPIQPEGGVRYTVPSFIRPGEMEDTLTVRFRVGEVYKNCYLATYFDDTLISRRKRPVMAPGEMEQVILDKKKLAEFPDLEQVRITIEEV